MEEVEGLKEIKVTATDEHGQPQIISVYTDGGTLNLKDIPQSLLELGEVGDKEGSQSGQGPQVIIQEITLPEGMSLDNGLIVANTSKEAIKRVTPRGSGRFGSKAFYNPCGECEVKLLSQPCQSTCSV